LHRGPTVAERSGLVAGGRESPAPRPEKRNGGLSLALRHDALQPAGADGVEERLTVLEDRRAQQAFDVPWLRIAGRCHGSRETRSAIERAGFIIERCDAFVFPPFPLAPPTAPHILGIALALRTSSEVESRGRLRASNSTQCIHGEQTPDLATGSPDLRISFAASSRRGATIALATREEVSRWMAGTGSG
jgi:hypothetical protein